MSHDPYAPYDPRDSINDLAFWQEVTGEPGISLPPPGYLYDPGSPVYGPSYISAVPPSAPLAYGQPVVIDNWGVPVGGTALVPYGYIPVPAVNSPSPDVSFQRPARGVLHSILVGIVILVIVALFGNHLVANPAKAPASKGAAHPVKEPVAPTGPYSVLGDPTISADFINRVLAAYHSPAAGKGQALYDLGVQYGIDPAFALAFFMRESTFGTQGEARTTLSLGNLRCNPDYPCVDQDRGGYAQMSSWEDGFKAWYALIRNYYVGQRGLDTVDKIIPVYAPGADHNDERGYICFLKYAVDLWRAQKIMVGKPPLSYCASVA